MNNLTNKEIMQIFAEVTTGHGMCRRFSIGTAEDGKYIAKAIVSYSPDNVRGETIYFSIGGKPQMFDNYFGHGSRLVFHGSTSTPLTEVDGQFYGQNREPFTC